MQGSLLFKKFLMPCGLCAAVPAVKPVSPPQETPKNCSNETEIKNLIRPSELPLYTFDECSKHVPCKDNPPSSLEQGVRKVRITIQDLLGQYQDFYDNVSTKIDTGFEHSRFMLDYLREESHLLPRVGAIGIGGLTGLIFGLRGGKFKKFVYSTTGASAIGAVCYPKQAEEGFNVAKHYANVSYNFIYGVKPGDNNQLEISLPDISKFKVPTSFSEFSQLVGEIGSTAAGAVSSLSDKALKAVTEKKEESQPAKDVETKKD